jgi:glycosyltransferase involved in cell wall biosynthesis
MLPLQPHWHLAFAGQGSERERLEELARALNVAQRVHFTGELDTHRVACFLKALDVFVFPTLTETFGLAVVEAAQAGVPVVVNDIEVMREVLQTEEGPCALFVDANDTQAFAAAVERLLNDVALRATLTARSGGLAARYSPETMNDRYADLIRTLSRPGRSPRPTPSPRG